MLVEVTLQDGVQQVEVPEQELFVFPRGLVGFEETSRYALFQLEEGMFLLQAAGEPQVGFVLLDPTTIDDSYRADLTGEDRVLLGLRTGDQPVLLAIATLSGDGVPVTANLRAPVALNPAGMLGAQVILHDSPHGVRHPVGAGLSAGQPGEDSPPDRRRAKGQRNGSRSR